MAADELAALLSEIRERVRARHPEGDASGIQLPDLMPLLHARDAAEAKVASIGSVNPRPRGLHHDAVQFVKRQISRGLGWFVRDQVEFNRSLMDCVEALLTALNESNRALAELTARTGAAQREAGEMKDVRSHWYRWREEWEQKVFKNEAQFLRAVADLQTGFTHRAAVSESNFRDTVKAQHAQFAASLSEATSEIQRRLWADLERIRLEYERLIHTELRLLRQRARAGASSSQAPDTPAQSPSSGPLFDYARFASRFRGSEEYVRQTQEFYRGYFKDRQEVLDIGCGRGEFLDLMREAAVPARGIDLDEESVAQCAAKGHSAERADLFVYLASLPDATLDGVFSAQVIEHLAADRLPEMIRLVSAKLRRGGLLAIETPNPECLAIFATHFYLDPTHTRPVPPQLMTFYLEENGFGGIEIHRLSPAIDSMPELAELPSAFREKFFGGLDYAIIGRKL